jgi:alkylresorcinol/alkylpyrone synthase
MESKASPPTPLERGDRPRLPTPYSQRHLHPTPTGSMARIVSVATANPPHLIDNDQAARIMTRHTRRLGLEPGPFLRILGNTRIESRYVVLSEDEVDAPMPLKQRNDLYIEQCLELGEQVAREAVARAGLVPADIDSVISVSCTGYMIPAMDAHLLNRMGLPTNIRRTPLTELGCIAGAVGLARAWEELQVYPDSNVLLLSVELPSLTFQPNDPRPTQIVSSMIFTDGAAAAVLSGRPNRPSPRLLGRRMYTMGGTLGDMAYNLDDDGLHIVLSPAVPHLIQRTLVPQVDALLDRHGLARADLTWFAVHPAGPKVLALIEQGLGIGREHLAASWKVLREYGNMSSAAVLFVLAEMLEDPPARPGDPGIIVAFGPGLSGEIVLARWEA